MVKINIEDLFGYDSQAVYVFLHRQPETAFEIILPRTCVEKDDDNITVCIEFLDAAYMGQLISELASSFAYYIPSVKWKEPFYFQATIHDMEKFADTLYRIISYYNPDADDWSDQMETWHLLYDAQAEDYKCNTRGLLKLAEKGLL